MSSTFSPSVTDLALYFSDSSNKINGCWVPQPVYTDKSNKIAVRQEWQMADLVEVQADTANDVFYVANLSRLAPAVQSKASGSPLSGVSPKAKDLVIIPSDDPSSAYVVPRDVYSNSAVCPPFAQNAQAAQIIVGALNMGVVLANIPKASNLIGWGCFMLSLISLRSGASAAAGSKSKGEYFGSLEFK